MREGENWGNHKKKPFTHSFGNAKTRKEKSST
jgi:hypothetical protein